MSLGHGYTPMTKSHNSCKTCNIAKSNLYGHCVWVWTKSIKGCRRSCAHKILVCMYVRMDGEVQILMPTHNVVGYIITNRTRVCLWHLIETYHCLHLDLWLVCPALNCWLILSSQKSYLFSGSRHSILISVPLLTPTRGDNMCWPIPRLVLNVRHKIRHYGYWQPYIKACYVTGIWNLEVKHFNKEHISMGDSDGQTHRPQNN